VRVLVPNWFDDSVLSGMKSDSKSYEWPRPEHLQFSGKNSQQRALSSTDAHIPSPSHSPVPASGAKELWSKSRILLSNRLRLTGTRRDFLERYIHQANGVAVRFDSNDGNANGTDEEELSLVDGCDIYITSTRCGPAFFKAWRENKTIGTLPWLLHCQIKGAVSSPRAQLLHFPVCAERVMCFGAQEICLTNYTGPSRDYLKKLITLMGGQVTSSLSRNNTILVAANNTGPKVDKAQQWLTPIVNHLWVLDCFVRWSNIHPGAPKY
ncbi:BRCT domain-containing protein, partial [Roridomyces roridus]